MSPHRCDSVTSSSRNFVKYPKCAYKIPCRSGASWSIKCTKTTHNYSGNKIERQAEKIRKTKRVEGDKKCCLKKQTKTKKKQLRSDLTAIADAAKLRDLFFDFLLQSNLAALCFKFCLFLLIFSFYFATFTFSHTTGVFARLINVKSRWCRQSVWQSGVKIKTRLFFYYI